MQGPRKKYISQWTRINDKYDSCKYLERKQKRHIKQAYSTKCIVKITMKKVNTHQKRIKHKTLAANTTQTTENSQQPHMKHK
jgi:hypothetical protein